MEDIKVWRKRCELIQATLRYCGSQLHSDMHPEDVHGADEIDYCNDMIDGLAKELAELLSNG